MGVFIFGGSQIASASGGLLKQVQRRGGEYLQVKDEWRDRLLPYLYAQFPQTQGHVAFAEVATPLTTNHYLHTLRGENYGLAQSLNRFKLQAQLHLGPATDVKGLSLVGQVARFSPFSL